MGQNLHDHFALFLGFKLKNPERGLALGKLKSPAFFKGLPYDWVINELGKPENVQNALQKEAATDPLAQPLLTFPRPLVRILPSMPQLAFLEFRTTVPILQPPR